MKRTPDLSNETARLHQSAATATWLAREARRRAYTGASEQWWSGTSGSLSELPIPPIEYGNVTARAQPSKPQPEAEPELEAEPESEAENEPENDPRKGEAPVTKKQRTARENSVNSREGGVNPPFP